MRSLAVAALASLLAPAALAMSPWEASLNAQVLQRPLPSKIHVAELREGAEVQQSPPQIMFAPGGAPLPIYLNRHGGSYTCGNFDDSSRNISTVMCGSSGGNVGDFSLSDASWNAVRDCVADLFSPFNVYVTDLEPTEGEYVEAVVGGEPGDAGMPFGVGGVAPFSCGLIPNAVVYAFADVYGNDVQGICETVGQEVAHAFGLDHEFLCEDPMTYLGGCGDKSFQDTFAQCGEFEPRECSCGGTSQNSVQMMNEVLGPSDGSIPPPPPEDLEEPVVSLTSPADGDILTANSLISVSAEASDDIGLVNVTLEWDYTGEGMFCPASFNQTGAYECERNGSNYTWNIQVGEGSRTFRVSVRDVAGNTAVTEDRTIWLSTDGSGPPDDSAPPDVFIASPAEGAVLPANDVVEVVATIGDDSGVARAELLWTREGEEAFPCPYDDGQAVSCTVDGENYRWSLNVGQGFRSFRVRAVDLVGNVTVTDSRTLQLTPGAEPPADEDDDTIDVARGISCGDKLSSNASDADWFAVSAPAGQNVTVVVDGDAAGSISIVATKGPTSADVVTNGTNDVEFVGGEGVKVAVVPDTADAGAYTIEVVCEDAAPPGGGPGPIGCASGGIPALWLALMALVVRRRRR